MGGWQHIVGPIAEIGKWTHVAGTYDGRKMVLYLKIRLGLATLSTRAAGVKRNIGLVTLTKCASGTEVLVREK